MEIRHFVSKVFNNSNWYIRRAHIFEQPENWKLDGFEVPEDVELIFPAKYSDYEQSIGSELIPQEWRTQFKDRLNMNSHWLLIIRVEQELAYFSWVASESEYDDYMKFDSHSYSSNPYLFHCYTIKKHRGRGLHYLATTFLMKHFSSEGKKLWGIVYSSNSTAQYVWKKAGLEVKSLIVSFGINNVNKKFIVSH